MIKIASKFMDRYNSSGTKEQALGYGKRIVISDVRRDE
jgi:hypothetical protein